MNLPDFHLPPAFEQFAKFCVVGTIGFVADAGTLYLFMSMATWAPTPAASSRFCSPPRSRGF